MDKTFGFGFCIFYVILGKGDQSVQKIRFQLSEGLDQVDKKQGQPLPRDSQGHKELNWKNT